jgi:hypothetical protein
MNLEDNLRQRLEAMQTPPSRVDVELLVGAGRRRAFRRRSAEAAGGVALVAAVLLAVPWVLNAANAEPNASPAVGGSSGAQAGSPPATPPSPTVVPTPGGASALAVPTTRAGRCAMAELSTPKDMRRVMPAAVDPTGRYIVGNVTVGQNYQAVLWTDGVPQPLPQAGKSVRAAAVNAGGVVAGLVTDGVEPEVFRYQDGRLTRLRTPAGSWHVYPEPAINAAGDIVVNAEPKGNSGGEGSIVLLWEAGATDATRLPLPAGANVFDLDDDGTLVGALYSKGHAVDAYAWDRRGEGRKLARPAGSDGAAAYAVSGDWATGGVWENSVGTTAVWNIRTGAVTDLKSPEPGKKVNTAGWVVDATGRVLRDGGDPRLTVPGGQVAIAQDIADSGLVVGQAMKGDGANLGPRTWRC